LNVKSFYGMNLYLGENISFEVIDICRSVNPQLVIFRARFSALTSRYIQTATTKCDILFFHFLNAIVWIFVL
jgi:DNA topoisomerase IA